MKLSREEFQDIVHDVAGRELVRGSFSWHNAEWKDRTALTVEWQTGGMSGGNCWGGEPNWPLDSDPEPGFNELDEILMKICPDIGLLQYRKIEQLIQRTSRHEPDYYGNFTTFGVKSIEIDALWECLIELGLVEPK